MIVHKQPREGGVGNLQIILSKVPRQVPKLALVLVETKRKEIVLKEFWRGQNHKITTHSHSNSKNQFRLKKLDVHFPWHFKAMQFPPKLKVQVAWSSIT